MVHCIPMTNATTTKATTGSHVGLTSEYRADHDIAVDSVFEVVDHNTRWGFRVAPVCADETGRRVRDFSEARWIDADAIARVYT
jgi:hypothetical protein